MDLDKYDNFPTKDLISIIAKGFNCETGEVHTYPCYRKWRGTSDVLLVLNSGAKVFLGNRVTPKAKLKGEQRKMLACVARRYNPETIRLNKEVAFQSLKKLEVIDNAAAARMGYCPYKVLSVEFNDGMDNELYMEWYYVVLLVNGSIRVHLETGLSHDIANRIVSPSQTKSPFRVAGAVREEDVDYVFNNIGFSSTSSLYTFPLSDEKLEFFQKMIPEESSEN